MRDPQNFFTPEGIFKLMERSQKLVVPGECDTSDCLARLINEELREALGPKVFRGKRNNVDGRNTSYSVYWSEYEKDETLFDIKGSAHLFCQREVGK